MPCIIGALSLLAPRHLEERPARRAGTNSPSITLAAPLGGKILRTLRGCPHRTCSGGLAVRAAHVRAQFPGKEPRKETKGQKDDFREFLLDYVRDVNPQVVEETVQAAPTQVVEAMQHTLSNMLGTLPPEFFDVRVSTVAGNLVQLMHTVIMTGYMFRNAEIRLGLHRSFGLLAPGGRDRALPVDACSAFTAQKTKVQGNVIRWNDETGAESMSAVEYMVQLEEEVKMLRDKVDEQRTDVGRNDLLAYIRSLDNIALEALTEGAGEGVKSAVNVFIQRILDITDSNELQTKSCETAVSELAEQLYWPMIVGYNLRTLEVRHEMELICSRPTFELPEEV